MQFSLRTFLILAIAVAVSAGLYLNVLRERHIERELAARVSHYPAGGSFLVDRELTDDQLIGLFGKYSSRLDEPEVMNIAAHSMFNLVIRDHPQGVIHARHYLETDTSPLWQTAVHSLLYHLELPGGVEGEVMEDKINEGFDRNTPLGEYVLAGNVLWDFVRCDESSTLRDNWHDPARRTAYEDGVAALEKVYPPAAKPYAKIIAILRETNGECPSSPAQQDELSRLDQEVRVLLETEAAVLRHLVRHPELKDAELGQTSPRSWEHVNVFETTDQ